MPLESSEVLKQEGNTYKDFTVTKYLDLSEIQSSLRELVHGPSGARIMHIANDDPENLFCLSFQTLPYNSNGIAHILEHIVLCGSKKFPVKDPFFSMTRRSLNTYMNALTGQDFTCYPASSQVEKDFYNLLEVYLDAVFFPELKYLSFLQEGHRLEFVKEQLEIQGVVYNEMKGAMSSIDSRLWEALFKRLTPDLPYAHNSGGSPQEIPNLSYQELLDFHREFYHPSRCLFFFYGDLSLDKHLKVLEPLLEGVPKVSLLPPLPPQKRFQEPVIAQDVFPASESQELKSQVIFSWLTAPISSQTELLALEVIESILTETDASLLSKALLKSGLCTQVSSLLDTEMSEVPLILICKGCEEDSAQKLQELLFKTFQKVEFSKEKIESALHQLEFDRSEIGGDGGPFGLSLFMRSALLKQHGCKPEDGLLVHSLFDNLRNRIQDPRYLPSIFEKHIVNNPHLVRLTLKPDLQLNEKETQEEKKRVQSILKTLTEEQKQKILKESHELKQYQEEQERKSLSLLPKLSLSDVPKKAKDFSLHQTEHLFHHGCFTNQILYVDLVFELPEMEEKELPLLSFLAQILPELGCGTRDYEQNLDYQQRYIGGFDASLITYTPFKGGCEPTFCLRGKALYAYADQLFHLFSDYVKQIDFQDRERIKEWLSSHATEQKERLSRSPMGFAIQSSLKHLSHVNFLQEKWHGKSYYEAVLAWEKSCHDHFFKSLENLAKKILRSKHYKWVISCDQDFYETLQRKPFFHLPQAHEDPLPYKANVTLPDPEPQNVFIASPVAFNSLGLKSIPYEHPDSPLLLIGAELMKDLVLHKQIREMGGAYGSGAQYLSGSESFYFFSYRDPHQKKTLKAFEKAVDEIGKAQFSEEELEEAKLGVLQKMDAPVPPGARAQVAYSWKRSAKSYEIRNQHRNTMLKATKEEVARAVQEHLHLDQGTLVSFLGKEIFEKENHSRD